MPRIVVFTNNNARILYVEDPNSFRGQPGVVIDPDLSEVSGLAPHFWCLKDGKIKPVSEDQMQEINDRHKREGVDNKVAIPIEKAFSLPSAKKAPSYGYVWAVLAGIVLSIIFALYWASK